MKTSIQFDVLYSARSSFDTNGFAVTTTLISGYYISLKSTNLLK